VVLDVEDHVGDMIGMGDSDKLSPQDRTAAATVVTANTCARVRVQTVQTVELYRLDEDFYDEL
jgi:hypothetical protein